ncbi:hypothetical protein [Dyadobacter sp. LHD-138]|uniref:hypothetical protein n=1 Tax=Dyadobacter sp. LHD-138 TaxID=3071413 RepID=UPI0027E20858|nr:hypothetical protein [Dyadobacter sp. LHD-138]MDQ6482224.1 hypothetical protein [Dyadobacter sp. LHD-138]
MIIQYPYDLYTSTVIGGGKDEDGNPIPAETAWSKVGICRDETDSKGQVKIVVDGIAYVSNFIVLIKKMELIIAVGTEIEVREGGDIRVKGSVKQFRKGQFHSKLWV